VMLSCYMGDSILLLGYYLILRLGKGFEMSEENIIAVVDKALWGTAHMYKDTTPEGVQIAFDPEGLLSTLPSIVILLGTQDIKNKILKILNYDDAHVKNVDFESAEVLVPDVAYDYGRGVYWFPDHMFNVVIPYLKVNTPQVSREYYVTNEFPNGMGYFSD